MKKLLYILSISSITLWSCGGSGEGGAVEETASGNEEPGMKGGVEMDLTEYGMTYTIMVPGNVEIMANEWGGVEIRKGEGFMISLAFGEGDLELMKSDLNSDLLYKSMILDEGADHILYKREIPDSGMEPEYHFFYVLKNGADVIEAQNMKDNIFSEEAARKMLSSAKTLKPKAGA